MRAGVRAGLRAGLRVRVIGSLAQPLGARVVLAQQQLEHAGEDVGGGDLAWVHPRGDEEDRPPGEAQRPVAALWAQAFAPGQRRLALSRRGEHRTAPSASSSSSAAAAASASTAAAAGGERCDGDAVEPAAVQRATQQLAMVVDAGGAALRQAERRGGDGGGVAPG